jgi:hypothetical protein
MSAIDLSGLFQIQSQYLLPNLNPSDPTAAPVINGIQQQLNSLNTSFNQANISADNILDHQTEMLNIVNTEMDRLNSKKQAVDTALDGKKRGVQLNESYRLRYQEYTKMVVVIVITLALFILISSLSRVFPFIPSFVFEFLSIIVIAGGLFSIYYIYINILSRSPTNFNELNIPGPKTDTPAEKAAAQEAAARSGNLLGSINLNQCIGSSCCSTGTIWDSGNTLCIPDPTYRLPGTAASATALTGSAVATGTSAASGARSNFTTISIAYELGELAPNKMAKVKAISPNEYENYGKYR